ncbi:MAG TPA: peroxiredoxin [Bacteroidales bacterium]|nr:peroxiredoxin [Bacteroidales bacterium]HBZ21705.1 peroxiredoxin [Bacteroidales bacterium]
MKKRIGLLIVFIMASVVMYSQKTLSVGDKVPRFKATADDGSAWDISKNIGKDYLVIYFFPGAMTSGCTKQACSYRDHQTDLASADAIVVGISGDKPENLKLFRHAENLNFPLLSDEKGNIAESFGVPVGEGATIKRTVDGIEHELVRDLTIKRWTFIVGKDDKIVYKNEAVNAEKDTEEVLNFLRAQK